MPIPETNLKGYNVLIYIPGEFGPIGDYKWSLKHATCAVRSAEYFAHNGVWAGIASVSDYRQSLGSLREENTVFPSVTVELSRGGGPESLSNDIVQDIRDRDYLVGAQAFFFLVSETDPAPSSSNRFHLGVIERGDVEIDRYTVRITCRDRMESEDRQIPRTRFLQEPPVEERQFGQPVPILIGAWDRETSDYWIPATCVNTALAADDQPIITQLCRPGDHGIASFGLRARWLDADGLYKRDETGYREQAIEVVDAAEGIFRLAGTDFENFGRRWEDGDRIQVYRPRGNTDSGGSLIELPSEVIRHLLTDTRVGMGLAELALDAGSFDAVSEIMSYYGYRCRGYICDETTVLDVLSEICHEFGLKLIVRNGQYALVYLGWNDSFKQPGKKITPGQILDWREWNDRQRAGARGLILKYRRRPEDDAFTRTTLFSSDVNADAGFRKIESRWIYDDDTADQRGSNWALMFAGVLRTIGLTADFEARGIGLGDYVQLDWPEGSGVFQVSEINFSFTPPLRLEMELHTMNAPSQVGVWSAEPGEDVPEEFGGGLMPADWQGSTDAQRRSLSFWVDEDGMNYDGNPGKVWGR